MLFPFRRSSARKSRKASLNADTLKSRLEAEVDKASALADALSRAAALEAERVADAADTAEAVKVGALADAAEDAADALEEAVARAVAKERAEAGERIGAACVVCQEGQANQMPFMCAHILMCPGKKVVGAADADCALRIVASGTGCLWCQVRTVRT